jgi:uncharacterized protein
MITAPDAVLVAAAGVIAGIVGTAGGITSLVSYPALLAAGVAPLPANVANIVALVACWPGSALASRPELAGRGPWLWRWGWVAAAGGAAGAVLLFVTPSAAFSHVVPFLVAAGSLVLLVQPRLSALRQGGDRAGDRAQEERGDRDEGRVGEEHEDRVRGERGGPGGGRGRRNTLVLLAALLAVSAYNGYFGAGSGVMTLGLMLLTVDQHMATANALKNMLIGAGSVTSALILVIVVPVDWAAVVPLSLGLFAGSTIGPRLARRIPARLLRWAVVFLGLGLAVKLWVAPA